MKSNFSTLSRFKNTVVAATLAVVFVVPLQNTAHATGFPVIDAANVVQSTVTAVEAVINTAQNYVSMIEDIKQTARNITSFDVASVFLDDEQKTALMSFIESGQSVNGALRKTQDIYEDFNRVFASSPYTNYEEFLMNIGTRKEHGDVMAKELYDSAELAEDELAKAHEQHMKVVNDMPNIEGVTDAALATAQSVGVVIQQNQGMIQLMSTSNRIQGQELQREYDDRAKLEESNKAYIEDAKRRADNDRAIFGN